ncbi:Wadjet anti-phage system protein JetD domain-containing protein [Psychrobacillus psychrodurans]|uniref:DUF2220 domain-containing protein n=1 Tax=Psychrobacillus psychrodurans TaxID=126157 RepID=A0A9X3L8Z8_9BACI|nr:Wadjet anti-phage system protein JetD domain-containing protein [Psychrobacillus psychrodurans]MCZ8533337.1 DUF2220 domain-containing protein [Psychrobacillus psychrodurans]
MDELKQFLVRYKFSKITILQLAEQCPQLGYEQFAELIIHLEQQKILTAIKSSHTNGKQPSLANAYKINKTVVLQNVREQVKQLKKIFHPAISVEYYLTKTSDELEGDLTALQQLNQYLLKNDLPKTKAMAQERSYEIFNNEKFISEYGGKKLLEKVKTWDLLEIWPIADPVSFAVNPLNLGNDLHKFLIIENKATFYSLLPALKDSTFTALIYGQGNAITGTIQVLHEQLPVNYEHVQFYYFGDIDAEGISIWYSLKQKVNVKLALPFYLACLQKSAAKGKEYQRRNEEAFQVFLDYFDVMQQKQIREILKKGFYYPQEILNVEELQSVWRNARWT